MHGNGSGRAFRGLALVFSLTFVNLVGVLVTAAAIGGVQPWTRWEFIGLFGVAEVASGLSNVVSPNIWHLPVTELRTSERADTKLAGSALLLPHWGGLARSVAGTICVAGAAWQNGISWASLGLVPFALALAWCVLAISAVLARAGVAWPEFDVLQFVIRWGARERELAPISIGASLFQFLLSVVTLPAAKLFAPSVLYRPEIGPSSTALLITLLAALALLLPVYALWSGRIEVHAPREQQREAEQEA